MRILVCIPYHYYNSLTITLSYYYTAMVLRKMGHQVHVFEFIEQAQDNKDGMNDFFLSAIKNIGYDLVFIETAQDEFYAEVLDEAKRYTITVAWNSDDDWRWEDYSSKWCRHYTYMVTTYRHVYEANKQSHPNLLLSQWACTGVFDGMATPKDIDFSFVGKIYGDRNQRLLQIRKRVPITVFGKGTLQSRSIIWKARRRLAGMLMGSCWQAPDRTLHYPEVNDIWNRSKVSFTPLRASRSGRLQIKGRVFEMGLSGTVMLCDRNPALYEFYEPDREFVEFDSIEDCVQKAKYLISHDQERLRIAEAYYRRTKAQHLWIHRYHELFKAIGLEHD